MTETPNAQATAPTQVTEVSVPPTSPKPYDDEIFDSYTTEDVTGTEPDASSSDAPQKEEVKEETPKAPEEEAQAEAPPKEEINKATKNDKVEDGIEEIAIKRPINGKEVNFKIKDAIQAYVKQEEFNRNMDRRITHISQREQAWKTDQSNFKTNLSKLMEVAQGGDFITAVRGLAKIATHGTQLDPVEFEKQYFNQLDKVREVWTKMNPEQREAYFAKRALQDAKARATELEEEKSVNVQKSQLQEKVQALQKQFEIPDNEFWGNYKLLSEELVKRGVVKSSDEIQAEHVVNFSLESRRQAKVFEAAKRAGLTDDAKIEAIATVTASDPTLSADDIFEIIKQGNLVDVAPKSTVENLNKKAGTSKTQFSKASSTKKDEKTNGYAKEDLEFLYRNQPKGYSRTVLR